MRHARCPACQTLFRVTEEQLDARGGRVRCGQCAHVFNAREGMVDEGLVTLEAPEAEAYVGGELEHWPDVPKLHEAPGAPAVETLNPSEVKPFLRETGRETSSAPVSPEAQAVAPGVADWADERPEMRLPPSPRQGSRGWVVAFGVLVFMAVLQGLWVFRAELAMVLPDLRPQLVAACDSLGCDMPLPKEASQIGIEGSELRPSPQGASLLKLAATLRNRAGYVQAYPHLELTLTDTDDKALARRVIVPGDYLAPKVPQAAGFPANSDLPISLTLDPSSLSPAGYRLYIFYP